jgi:two-component system, sensor histidine kinase SagS
VSDKPRILVLGSARQEGDSLLSRPWSDCELIRADDPERGLSLLHAEHFDAIFADTHDPAVWNKAEHLLQAERILEALPDGVAVVTPDLRVFWANTTFQRWCGSTVQGRGFYEALGSPELLGPDYCPFHTALAGKTVATRIHCHDNRYLELHVTPIYGSDHKIVQLISLGRDVTEEVQKQQKLDALHQGGSQLAQLDPNELAQVTVAERVEHLKLNIRKLTHDLLHYDVIEIRLLDPRTGRLEPLLQEGMTPEAAGRALYASAEGNGITGFVAATGKSYLCPDTANDPLYILGAAGARSSLTVPLLVQDEVIGTFNVENPSLNAFGEEDLKFAETFSREIAHALNTLQLLTAEKMSTASQSVEAVAREVALPVDEILASTTAILDRYIGHDEEMADKLRRILASARAIKQSIQKVGEDITTTVSAPQQPTPKPPALKGLRLLVADNDERVRRSAHGILGRLGCIVETARDGQEALTMARLCNYDAILADIRLPDVAGDEVYRKLREVQPNARVILMTAYGYDPSHAIVKARQDGLRQVLFKPFRVDQLLDALTSTAPGEVVGAKCGA